MVHGSLWPQNVLIGTDGMVRISDFGAWSLPLEVDSGGGPSIRTRYCYRSPEHVAGTDLTRATDVFGVGVLLYTMLTGKPPFLGETLMETVGLVERADLRSWLTLPREWQAARAVLPPGAHTLELTTSGGDSVRLGRYELEEGETMLIFARSVDGWLEAHPIGGLRVE